MERRALHVCPSCASGLVQPRTWSTVAMTLWCPNCWWQETASYRSDALEAYDRELARGTRVLAEAAERLAATPG